MDDLTNEQKLLLTAMYRDYLELSKKVGPEKANAFGDSDEINYKYFIDRSNSYVSSLCWTVGHYIVKAILIAMVEITKLTKFQLPMIQSSTLKTNSKIILLKC